MEISIEKLEGLQRRITVVVPEARVTAAVEAELKKLMHTANLKGFRKGKIPYDIVKQRFGDAVFHDVVHNLADTTLKEALNQQPEPFTIIGNPKPNIKHHKPNQPLSYEATFEVYPEIELHDLSGIRLEKLTSEITQEDIERVLNKLQQQFAQWQIVPRAAQLGDRVIIDFEGTHEDNPVAGAKAQEFALILGSKAMIPGFEDALIGSQAHNEVNIPLTFPENYFHKDLSSKTVNFKILVNKVEEPILPALDNEFAKSLGIADGGMEQLQEEIRQNMQREIAQLIQNDLKRKVWDEWLRLNSFEIPPSLIELEIDRLLKQLTQQLAAPNDLKQKIPDLPRGQFKNEAIRRVRLGLLLNEFIQQQQLTVAPAKIANKINEIAAAYDNPQEIATHIKDTPEELGEVHALLLEDLALDKLLENADIQEKFIPCHELIKLKDSKSPQKEI
jgi:trigger factor